MNVDFRSYLRWLDRRSSSLHDLTRLLCTILRMLARMKFSRGSRQLQLPQDLMLAYLKANRSHATVER